MNRDRFAGCWRQATGIVKEQWGRLIDNPFVVISGKRDRFAGRTQEMYGVAQDAAERQHRVWETRYEQLFDAHSKNTP